MPASKKEPKAKKNEEGISLRPVPSLPLSGKMNAKGRRYENSKEKSIIPVIARSGATKQSK